MNDGVRRVGLVLAAYLAVTFVVVAVTSWARPVLALPALFERLVRGALVVGLPLALLLAWHYPKIGHHGAAPDPDGGGR